MTETEFASAWKKEAKLALPRLRARDGVEYKPRWGCRIKHPGMKNDILVLLKKSGTMTRKQLADKFKVATNTVSNHLKALEVEGKVVREGKRNAKYSLKGE